jgi:Reverse transcriptase (RNA-dependent DNA polymerase)
MILLGGSFVSNVTARTRLFLRFSSNFPLLAYAGKYVEVFGALYGLKESNRLFADEVDKVLRAASFRRVDVGSGTYVRRAPGGGLCIVVVHVDNFRAASNMQSLVTSLRTCLINRFDEITEHGESTQYAGVETTIDPISKAILCTQRKYVEKIARSIGIAHMPRDILLPCGPDFYELSSSAADLLPSDPSAYMSLTGSLVHACQTRDDIKDKVSLLCSRNSSPTAGDFAKGIQVLRYLYSTPHIGRVYDSTSTEIVGFSDSAFMVHRDTGRSSTAFFFSVGVNNAATFLECC